jgi:hypothetical protein
MKRRELITFLSGAAVARPLPCARSSPRCNDPLARSLGSDPQVRLALG